MLILLLLSVAMILIPAESANHYCFDQNTVRFSMRSDTDQPERLLTNIRNRNRYAASQRCRWELVIRDLTEPRYLMLQPMTQPMRSLTNVHRDANDSVSCDSKLSVNLQGSAFHQTWYNDQSLPTISMIVPYESSLQKLVASFTTGDSEPSADCPRVELNIKLVKKGFCGRNMLLHRSHCHLVSDREIGMVDLRETGLRLTAFSSMDDVQQLIRDNDLRIQQYPYILPLNLTSPVRVGVFRCSGSVDAFYFESVNGSLVSQPFKLSQQSKDDALKMVNRETNSSSHLQCASIRVSQSGEVALEFYDCDIPMRSLVSFPEVPGRQDSMVAGDFEQILKSACSSGGQNVFHEGSNASSHIYVIIILLALCLIAIGVTIVLCFCLVFREECIAKPISFNVPSNVRFNYRTFSSPVETEKGQCSM